MMLQRAGLSDVPLREHDLDLTISMVKSISDAAV